MEFPKYKLKKYDVFHGHFLGIGKRWNSYYE